MVVSAGWRVPLVVAIVAGQLLGSARILADAAASIDRDADLVAAAMGAVPLRAMVSDVGPGLVYVPAVPPGVAEDVGLAGRWRAAVLALDTPSRGGRVMVWHNPKPLCATWPICCR